ncbi:hypothetical protein [Pseudomonas fluorescens]|uniref:hypothetical protein n=1 Tax=Pseudomonas fluorescens TaxID=294 RepID=UPI0011CDE05F|nr:hypothetical protein [Pseudomonas fluorescens]
MKNGICGLCKRLAILKKSHLLPKSAYKVLRSSGAKFSPPTKVEIDRKRFVQTDRQIVEYFLCGKCEQTFSTRGEDVVSKLWARGERFPLLDILQLLPPVSIRGENYGYATEDLDPFIVRSLHYFAVSVVWRAIKWPGEDCSFGGDDVRVSCESLRRIEEYLLGGCIHLENSLIMISVNTYDGLNDIISIPSSHAGEELNFFEFYILGLRFRVFLNFRFFESKIRIIENGLNVMIMTADHGNEPFIKEVANFFFKNNIG